MLSGGSNMKYKLKDKPMDMWDSYKGLGFKVWTKLNNGESVELKKVPDVAKPYLVKIKKEK